MSSTNVIGTLVYSHSRDSNSPSVKLGLKSFVKLGLKSFVKLDQPIAIDSDQVLAAMGITLR
jgi:hypothetical protein